MKQGVILCGLNGSGKSTLGRALAQRLGWEFLDIEDCFIPKTDPSCLYANPRSPQEAAALLVERANAAENFVLASVKGHYPGLAPLLTGAVWLRVDKATRARRVRQRSYEKFGERMGPGDDLFQQEEDFFAFTAQREDSEVEAWLATLRCPVVEVDGTLPIQENVERLAGRFSHR